MTSHENQEFYDWSVQITLVIILQLYTIVQILQLHDLVLCNVFISMGCVYSDQMVLLKNLLQYWLTFN